MLLFFLGVPFATTAYGAAVSPTITATIERATTNNSLTTAPTTTPSITAAPTQTTLPPGMGLCDPWDDPQGKGQDCARSGAPFWNNEWQSWSSVYATLYQYWRFFGPIPDDSPLDFDTNTSLDDMCWTSMSSAMGNWLATAPITPAGSMVSGYTRTESHDDIIITAWFISTTSTAIITEIKTVLTVLSTDASGFVRASVDTDTTYTTYTSGFPFYGRASIGTTITRTGITRTETRSAYTAYGYVPGFTWIPAEPCCSRCTIFGGTVSVFHFPTPAPTPAVSILVDKNNFTFVSPSVYVAFQSLFATNLCGTLGNTVYISTTMAFDQNEITTGVDFNWTTSMGQPQPSLYKYKWQQAEFNTSITCGPTTNVFYQILDEGTGITYTDAAQASSVLATLTTQQNTQFYKTVTGVPLVQTYTVTYNPCTLSLKVPINLYWLNPSWTSCVPAVSAFYDPPYYLTTGGPLGLVTPRAQVAHPETTSTNIPPAAVATANPDIATSTSNPNNPVQNDRGDTKSATQPAGPGSEPTAVANPSQSYILGGQTLIPGGSALTVSGTVVSLLPGGSSVVVGGSTQPIGDILSSAFLITTSAAGFIIGSQTLVAGGSPITVDGTVMSLLPGGSSVVVAGTTQDVGVLSRDGAKSTIVQETLYSSAAFNGSVLVGAAKNSRSPLDRQVWVVGILLGTLLICVGIM